MADWKEKISHITRDPIVPPEFREELRRSIALSNSRRLKAVTWLLLSSLVVYMVADYMTIAKAGEDEIWFGILIMRPLAVVACILFLQLFGPLRTLEDIKPRHYWVWKAYTYFFLVYTALIVGFMFPLKESIAPVYIFLLGPPAFIAMTSRQTVVLMLLGLCSIAGSLYFFVPDALTAKYHLINAMIITWVSYVVAHITYAGTYRDFMNKKVIEQKNQELDDARVKAEAANRAKSDFLAAISHEIRTPMNSILGMTEVALHTPLDVDQRDYIETARESALHLLDVMNDILDFSRIEARKLRLISAHFALSGVLQSALKTIRLQADMKGVTLGYEIKPGTHEYLRGDPGRLRQILINLLSNAVKFTDQGSIHVRVEPHQEWGGEGQLPVALRFTVKDTGTGIPPDKLQRIFEAFTQVDGSTSRSYGGSGLGLAICENLVKLMGGTLSVQSVEGEGSEFVFIVRFAEGEAAHASEADLSQDSWSNMPPVKVSRILLVDDNPLNVKVERLHLERMGMNIVVAENGAEALNLLAEEDFDLVLLDLEMPGIDGHETALRIRSGEGGGRPVRQPDVPILAVTAHALGEVRDKCEAAGMNGFVTKPIGFGELASAMRQILGGGWEQSGDQPRTHTVTPVVLDIVEASTLLGVSTSEIRHLVPNAMTEISLKYELAELGIRRGLLDDVSMQAHTLKSVAASIGAEATRRAAVKLEHASRRDDATLCSRRLAELQVEIARLVNAVGAL